MTTVGLAVLALTTAQPKQKITLQGEADVAKAFPPDAYAVVRMPGPAGSLENPPFAGVLPDAAVPSWWPSALRDDWENGTAHCRVRLGPPPYGGRATMTCSQDLSSALYQRLVEHFGGRVVQTAVVEASDHRSFTAVVTTFLPDETEARTLSETAPSRAEALAKLPALAPRVIAGNGELRDRPRGDSSLLRPLSADERTAESALHTYPPVEAPATCARAPRKLLLPVANAFGQALATRWEQSVANVAHGEPMSCELRQFSTQSFAAVLQTTTTLTCGSIRLSVVEASGVHSNAERKASDDLMRALFGALCK